MNDPAHYVIESFSLAVAFLAGMTAMGADVIEKDDHSWYVHSNEQLVAIVEIKPSSTGEPK